MSKTSKMLKVPKIPNVYKIIVIVVIFICIDVFKINHLWNENFHRRVTHHFQGNLFNPNKTPWINFFSQKLRPKEIDFINSINIEKNNSIQTISPLGSLLTGGNYSNKSTLYYDDFDPETQKELDKIGNRLKPDMEALCGEKLELGTSSFRCVLLRYEGEKAQFTYHYDAEPYNCYRTLFLVKKEGKVPPFTYFTKSGEKVDKHFDVGDGLFFKGTQTYHGVGKSNDPDLKRYMIGWQYTTNNAIKEKSLCNMFRSMKRNDVIKSILPHLIIPITIGIIIKYLFQFKLDSKEQKRLFFVSIVTAVIALLNVFKKFEKIGTKVPFNIAILAKLVVLSLISFMDLSIGLLYFNYLVLSEIVLPREWLITKNIGLFNN